MIEDERWIPDFSVLRSIRRPVPRRNGPITTATVETGVGVWQVSNICGKGNDHRLTLNIDL